MTAALEMFRRSVEVFGQRVTAIGPDDWARPTPCTDWSVRDLVRHLVYEELWAPPLLAGATMAEVGDRFEGDILHAWDLARGIGADDRLDPDLAQFVYDFLAPQAEQWRGAGVFAAAVDVP